MFTTDNLLAGLILLAIAVAVMGPMLWLLWWQARRALRALVALRDRIDRAQRH
ncbi:MAG: hypothetical protein IAE87_18440 [Rhodobacteraceae bacterium]|jgi:hypothetical protein|nr:hypothetical protein [Paracoccaceae bacterium]